MCYVSSRNPCSAYKFSTRVQAILHKDAIVHYGLANPVENEMSVFDSEISERESIPAPRVRKEFPETWLWESVDISR